MEYGRPDGSVRARFFEVEGWRDVGVAQLRDAKGRVVGWDMAPKALIASDKSLRRPDEVGRERTEGAPLEGEPVGIVIADERRLLQVLTALRVPVEQAEAYYAGTFDYAEGIEVPGPGAREKAFTFFGLGEEPAEPVPGKEARSPKADRPGLFRRLFKG
jgi:hypothetical protein